MDAAYYGGDGRTEVVPASAFLQERLQERRARNTRPHHRSRQSDVGPRRGRDDDLVLSDGDDTSRRAASRLYDGSPRRGADDPRRALGVKHVDGQLDQLSKQNFALKLEIDHRRQQASKLQRQMEAMRAQVERAELLKKEHAELLQINSDLVHELEKRDKAVEEAMDIICDLEDKVADLEERRSHTRPSTAQADSGYAGTETLEPAPPSSPPDVPPKAPKTPAVRPPPLAASAASHRFNTVINSDAAAARARRQPSVLSQKDPSTHALRSVYLEAAHTLHPVKSFTSLLSRRESRADEDSSAADEVLNSPRLSSLSESSFPSLYGPKKPTSPEKFAWEADDDDHMPSGPRLHLRQDSINRVSRWIDSGDAVVDTPSKATRVSSPLSESTERGASPQPPPPPPAEGSRFQSLNDALSAPATKPAYEMPPAVPRVRTPATTSAKKRTKQPRPSSIGGPVYGQPLVPPGPDHPSAHMLRGSRSSIAPDRPFRDTPAVATKGSKVRTQGPHTAPKQMHSSVELNRAYLGHQKVRHIGGNAQDDSSSESEDDRADAGSDRVKDLSMDYDGFPDGNSILMGTPSRFLKHGKPTAEQMFFDGHDVSPPPTARPPPRRRQSSSDATLSSRMPSLSRAETSPTFLGSLTKLVGSTPRSTVETLTSPRSHHSGSSGNRTVVQVGEARNRSLSPSGQNVQFSTSPSRRLSQKTHMLFRRLSNSQPERAEPPREKSALPTLTSTPSSAYINTVPKQVVRPTTSEMKQAPPPPPPPGGAAPRAPAPSREGFRPSLQSRTTSEPAGCRPASAAAIERPAGATPDRMNPFRRSNSTRKPVGGAPPPPAAESPVFGSRPAITRRRGSIRDAVTARKPWR